MGFVTRGLEVGAVLSTTSFLAGLATVAWLPDTVQLWGNIPIPRMLAILLIPVLAMTTSLFLALISSCDPYSPSQSSTSGAAIAAVVALPPLFALPLQAIALWAALTNHPIGTAPFAVLASLLAFVLAIVFRHVEQNYVVGIRDLWTLRSTRVWDDTHFVASLAFIAAGSAGIVLVFFVPQGIWQVVLIAGLFGVPTALSVLYSYLIREDQYQYIVR